MTIADAPWVAGGEGALDPALDWRGEAQTPARSPVCQFGSPEVSACRRRDVDRRIGGTTAPPLTRGAGGRFHVGSCRLSESAFPPDWGGRKGGSQPILLSVHTDQTGNCVGTGRSDRHDDGGDRGFRIPVAAVLAFVWAVTVPGVGVTVTAPDWRVRGLWWSYAAGAVASFLLGATWFLRGTWREGVIDRDTDEPTEPPESETRRSPPDPAGVDTSTEPPGDDD